jgi:ChrR Cupin-like domain
MLSERPLPWGRSWILTVTKHLPPDFARQAIEGSDPVAQRELLEVMNCLPEALPLAPPPIAVRTRLLEAIGEVPERYAPLARRLSELYDLPRAEVLGLLERSGDRRAWKASGLPHIEKLPVRAGSACVGAQAYLVKLAAGVRFPSHQHDGLETVLILSGSYTEDTGTRYQTGDVHVMEPGTAHSFTVDRDEDCVAATRLYGGLNFRSLPLRILARLLGH